MKKTLSAALITLAAATAMAQDAESIRVYINPGHGSWTANDRPMQVIGKGKYTAVGTDTTGFFESNTNLIKGLAMLEKLVDMGVPFDRDTNQEGELWQIGAAKDLEQQIVMSRVKNGPFEDENTKNSPNYELYNRSLFEICKEVEYNEFDIFVSIHSNAATEDGPTTNYHALLYRGYNGRGGVLASGSYEMAESATKYTMPNAHAAWSLDKPYIYGDIDFMGHGSGTTNSLGYLGYLGVLKHGCPGYLVEGYFHTYMPARHRGMNWDVDRMEGAAYARGVADYFGFDTDDTGDLYGIVRDIDEKFTHDLYKPSTRTDDVYLPLNGCTAILYQDGKEISRYVTDNFYNGAFVFPKLQPGTYQVGFEYAGYVPSDPVDVEVQAGQTATPKFFIKNQANVKIVPPDYPDPAYEAGNTLPDNIALNTAYTDKPVDQLQGKTIRRLLMRDNIAYILAADDTRNPTILAIDPATGTVISQISTQGCQGNQWAVSDIQLATDNVLVAIAAETLQYSATYVQEGEERGTLRLYYWQKDPATSLPTGDPILLHTTQSPAQWQRAVLGETFAITGTLEEGQIVLAARTLDGTDDLRTVAIPFCDKKAGVETISKPTAAHANAALLGADYRYVHSPLGADRYLVHGSGDIAALQEYSYVHTAKAAPHATLAQGFGAGATPFRYCGHALTVAPTTADGTTGGVIITDITDGLDKATPTNATGTALPDRTINGGHYAAAATRPDTPNHLDILVARDGALSLLTTETQSGIQNVTQTPEADTEYYTIQGTRVTRPTTPGIYILRQGNSVTKTIIR